MTPPDRAFLLDRLDQPREKLEKILSGIDLTREIYPGWTVKELLAHLTGWEEAAIQSLGDQLAGRTPAIPADHGIDEYNSRSVDSRRKVDYGSVFTEWQQTRLAFRSLIENLPDAMLIQPLIMPWGPKKTLGYLINLYGDHEEEHARDISAWLTHPDKPLRKGGK